MLPAPARPAPTAPRDSRDDNAPSGSSFSPLPLLSPAAAAAWQSSQGVALAASVQRLYSSAEYPEVLLALQTGVGADLDHGSQLVRELQAVQDAKVAQARERRRAAAGKGAGGGRAGVDTGGAALAADRRRGAPVDARAVVPAVPPQQARSTVVASPTKLALRPGPVLAQYGSKTALDSVVASVDSIRFDLSKRPRNHSLQQKCSQAILADPTLSTSATSYVTFVRALSRNIDPFPIVPALAVLYLTRISRTRAGRQVAELIPGPWPVVGASHPENELYEAYQTLFRMHRRLWERGCRSTDRDEYVRLTIADPYARELVGERNAADIKRIAGFGQALVPLGGAAPALPGPRIEEIEDLPPTSAQPASQSDRAPPPPSALAVQVGPVAIAPPRIHAPSLQPPPARTVFFSSDAPAPAVDAAVDDDLVSLEAAIKASLPHPANSGEGRATASRAESEVDPRRASPASIEVDDLDSQSRAPAVERDARPVAASDSDDDDDSLLSVDPAPSRRRRHRESSEHVRRMLLTPDLTPSEGSSIDLELRELALEAQQVAEASDGQADELDRTRGDDEAPGMPRRVRTVSSYGRVTTRPAKYQRDHRDSSDCDASPPLRWAGRRPKRGTRTTADDFVEPDDEYDRSDGGYSEYSERKIVDDFVVADDEYDEDDREYGRRKTLRKASSTPSPSPEFEPQQPALKPEEDAKASDSDGEGLDDDDEPVNVGTREAGASISASRSSTSPPREDQLQLQRSRTRSRSRSSFPPLEFEPEQRRRSSTRSPSPVEAPDQPAPPAPAVIKLLKLNPLSLVFQTYSPKPTRPAARERPRSQSDKRARSRSRSLSFDLSSAPATRPDPPAVEVSRTRPASDEGVRTSDDEASSPPPRPPVKCRRVVHPTKAEWAKGFVARGGLNGGRGGAWGGVA